MTGLELATNMLGLQVLDQLPTHLPENLGYVYSKYQKRSIHTIQIGYLNLASCIHTKLLG